MLQKPCKTLGFKKNMVYKIPLGGGKPYPASGLMDKRQQKYYLNLELNVKINLVFLQVGVSELVLTAIQIIKIVARKSLFHD